MTRKKLSTTNTNSPIDKRRDIEPSVFSDNAEFIAADLSGCSIGHVALVAGRSHIAVAGATSGSAGSIKDNWEPLVFDVEADLFTSQQAARGVGQYWFAGSSRYREASQSANDHHVTTAGGAKLYVDPPKGAPITAQSFGAGSGVVDDLAALQAAHDLAGQDAVEYRSGTINFTVPDGYDIYLLAGDDWMAGVNGGPIDDGVGGLDEPDPRILMYDYTNNNVATASLPLRNPTGSATGVSPGLQFAKDVLAKMPANRGIILVSAAHTFGVDSLAWRPGQVGYINAQIGLTAAFAQGSGTNRLVGVLYAGGEDDHQVGRDPAVYQGRLVSLIEGLRTDYVGSEQAWLVCAQFIPEYAGSGGGIDGAHASINLATQRATTIAAPASVQESSHRTTAAGSRALGSAFADALFSEPGGCLSVDYLQVPPEITGFKRRARVEQGVVFNPTWPRGDVIFERWVRPTIANLTDTRGINDLYMRAERNWLAESKGQWPGNLLTVSEKAIVAEWGGTAFESPQTTFHAVATGLPEGNGNVAAIGAMALGLGPQNTWGYVAVMCNSIGLDYPVGHTGAMLGMEIDIQPATGSNLDNGAGLLVNNFNDPVDFSGVSIVGDGGGSFRDGLFFGNVRRFGVWFGGTFDGTYAFYSRDAQCDKAAIGLNDGATNGIEFSNGAQTVRAYQVTSTGSLRVDSSARTVLTNGNTEGREILALASQATTTESVRAFVATGTTANSAASTMKMRANSITSRSINAGGTVNAAGADYAEYEIKREDCGPIKKGDLVGFDSDGLLTDKYDLAVGFAVKSTNPSLVGGDTWMDGLEEPLPPEYVKPDWAKRHGLGDRPVPSFARTSDEAALELGLDRMTKEELEVFFRTPEGKEFNQRQSRATREEVRQYDADMADWSERVKNHRAAFYQSDEWRRYEKEKAAFDQEAERRRRFVDRIAYCGKVPVNVEANATPGDYVVPVRTSSGHISGKAISPSKVSFDQYRKKVGQVRSIKDGKCVVAVSIV